MYAPSSLMNGEQILVGIYCLVSTENLASLEAADAPISLVKKGFLVRVGRK